MYLRRIVPSCVLWIVLFGAMATEVRAVTLNLMDFGAVGNGTTDDGPALQSALNALAAAGGGTLIVPEGRYAIITPVSKDFTGLATSITILGVESATQVDPTGGAPELAKGLDLKSELRPKTGSANIAIKITGLQAFLIKDVAFMGTNNVPTDAATTLWLEQIEQATVRHCEFYGLSTIVPGAMVMAVRSGLTVEQTKFLGSVTNSGNYASVIQNIEWKSIVVTDTVFLDYGLRGELYGKTGYGAPYSWINIGNPKAVVNNSPRREVSIRRVFLDEGGFIGVSSLPYRNEPSPPPIDLVYITNLRMNVSNLQTHGHYFTGVESVFIEKSRYQWSHNAISGVNLIGVRRHAIIDRSEFVDHAYRILADAATKRLSVINSIYTHLDSQAQTTRAFTTATPEEDPVQFVRQQFETVLGREPDPAAHYYWTDLLLRCDGDTQCVASVDADLNSYLNSAPSPAFSIQGIVKDENGNPVSGVAVALTGSQAVTTQTDASGQYSFSNLPTSGNYSLTPSKKHHIFSPVGTITTPSGDQVVNMTGTLNRHTLRGRITTSGVKSAANVTVTLSGSQNSVTTTDANGDWTFSNIPAGGNYTVTPSQSKNVFTPASSSVQDLSGDRIFNFTLVTHFINGWITRANGSAVSGVTVALSGSKTAATTTDPSGNYVFTELPAGGNYVITPTRAHTNFTPATHTINGLVANQTASFTATNVNYTISGKVRSSGVGLGGVTMGLSGSAVATTTTASDGSYSFSVAAEGNYTVTPSLKHHTAVPQSQSVNNLVSDKTLNFEGTLKRHTVSGRVANSSNQGVAGVSVQLSGSQTATVTTNANGEFSFTNLPSGGTFSITPAHAFHSFTPQNKTYVALDSDQQVSFLIEVRRHTITGRVRTSNGAGLAGATINLSGFQNGSTTTDASGNYSFANLAAGQDYSLTVSKTSYRFTPSSFAFSKLNSNQTADFSAVLIQHTISGRITVGSFAMSAVSVSLSGSQTGSAVTDANGNFSFVVPESGSYSVTPTNSRYAFTPAASSINNVANDVVTNFTARIKPGVPLLISHSNTTRGLVLDSLLGLTEPFELTYNLSWSSDRRTRLTLFTTNFALQPGEAITAITADAEDGLHRIYPLTVEYFGQVEEVPWLNRLVVRLNDDLGEVGDVLIRITYRGVPSNRVRVGIGNLGGGPPNDAGSFPTPGQAPN